MPCLIANMLSIIMFVYVHSEMIDAMFQPSLYVTVYPYNYLYNYFVTVPHFFLIQLASTTANAKYSKFTAVNILPCCIKKTGLDPRLWSCSLMWLVRNAPRSELKFSIMLFCSTDAILCHWQIRYVRSILIKRSTVTCAAAEREICLAAYKVNSHMAKHS